MYTLVTKQRRAGRSSASLTVSHLKESQARRDLLGLALLALSIITLLSLFSMTSGTLIDPWRDFVRNLFGWGAIPAMLNVGLLGLGLLRSNLNIEIQPEPGKAIAARSRKPRPPVRNPHQVRIAPESLPWSGDLARDGTDEWLEVAAYVVKEAGRASTTTFLQRRWMTNVGYPHLGAKVSFNTPILSPPVLLIRGPFSPPEVFTKRQGKSG